jgi:hypothetical protein
LFGDRREDEMNTTVKLQTDAVVINGLVTRDPRAVAFFEEISAESRAEVAIRALEVGVAGLRAAGVSGQLELVERKFTELAGEFSRGLSQVEIRLMDRVDTTFDPDEAGSVSARLGTTIGQAYGEALTVVDELKGSLEKTIGDTFDPDQTTSAVFRLSQLVDRTKAEIDRLFDPSRDDSHLSKLIAIIDDYFGEGGSAEDLVASQVNPVKEEILGELRELRDLVVGKAAAAAERKKSAASGWDFEDEVEEVLCRLASAHGDSVQRVGAERDDTGREKKGDFVVQLREGPRFVLEAKDRSNPVTLRGERGLLAALAASMANRNAAFGVAVMKSEAGYPKEVGCFNDYDGNKVLCVYGADGRLLDVAYRWARVSLLAGEDRAVDVAAVDEGVQEAREALRELARVKAKAKAIVTSADEIQAIVEFQVRRARRALDEASEGLVQQGSEKPAEQSRAG